MREADIKFRLDEPISEIFKKMREVSKNILKNLKPHPYYLSVSIKYIVLF